MSESFKFEPSYILTILQQRDSFQSNELAEQLCIDHQKLVGAIKSLQSHEEVYFLFYNIYLSLFFS
jgi:hypothetical protein